MTVTTDQKRSLEEDFKNLLISTLGKGIRYFIKTYIINNENNYYNRNNKNKNNRNEMIEINSFTVTGKLGQMMLIFPVKLMCKPIITIFCGDFLRQYFSHDLEAFCDIWGINILKIRQWKSFKKGHLIFL